MKIPILCLSSVRKQTNVVNDRGELYATCQHHFLSGRNSKDLPEKVNSNWSLQTGLDIIYMKVGGG